MKNLAGALVLLTLSTLVASTAIAADNPSATPAQPTVSAPAPPEAGGATAPTESGKGFAPGPVEYRIPIGGCEATVWCPAKTGGGSVTCISRAANGCVARQSATPPWVACDGVIKNCPTLN